jgi:chromosome partitioning protein
MPSILTISSLKGGVGKTTIAAFLAQALRGMGKRVLSVDLDHNNNLTDYHLRNVDVAEIEAANVRHVLNGTRKYEDCIVVETGRNVGPIIPATPSLATVGLELCRDPGAVLRLRSGLRKLEYDYIIIDTPPALTLELTAGLYAADLVLVPVSASRWTVQGYQVIADEVARVAEAIGQSPRMLAVPSMVTEAEAQVIQAAEVWTATKASIRRDTAIRSAASEGRELRTGTHGREWFDALAAEVMG